MLIGALPVLAATVDISIPLETIVRGTAGSTHVLAVVDVPQESIGEECDATVVARNQDSEHPDSNLTISSATSVEILDVENSAYGTVFGGGLITLADSVTVTLTLGTDRVFSGGLDVVIDCPPFSPTTTTTTTEGPGDTTDTSGGAGGTTDTSGGAGGTTDTSGGAGGTTDTSGGPGDTTDTSGGPGDTTDTSGGADGAGGDNTQASVLGSTITAADSSVAGSSETLPFTGLPQGNMGGVAFALLALGGLMVLSIRRRETEAIVARGWRGRVDFYDLGS
jgi:hypothetical protein